MPSHTRSITLASLLVLLTTLLTFASPQPLYASGEPGNASVEYGGNPPSLSSTVNSIQIVFAKDGTESKIWLRICADSPNFQMRAENVGQWTTEVFHKTEKANDCSPSAGGWYKMVYGIDTGSTSTFRIYATANDGILSEAAFMQRAASYDCHPTGHGTGYCTPNNISAPAGSIDEPSAGQAVQGSVTVRGWAIDSASLNGTSITEVKVKVNGTEVGTASYGEPRTDVAGAYSDARYGSSGYRLSFDSRQFANGTANVQVAYRSVISGNWSTIDRQVVIDNVTDDTIPPDGRVTSPLNNTRLGPASLNFIAEASDNVGGSGVALVKFFVRYDGRWNPVGEDAIAPYNIIWQTPTGLQSQLLTFTIHVVDGKGNIRMDPGGYHYVSFSAAQEAMMERWIPYEKRAYLNQRALTDKYGEGRIKCGITSVTMLLAMNGVISKDPAIMAEKAKQLYPTALYKGSTDSTLLARALNQNGLIAKAHNNNNAIPADQAWSIIKTEIDNGRPVMVNSNGEMTTYGHFYVAVGYQESGSVRTLIAYDPYGKWLGSQNKYDRNSDSLSSQKGKWVFYDFRQVFGADGGVITAQPRITLATSTPWHYLTADEADGFPDEMSMEESDIATDYEGISISTSSDIFLPLLIQ